MMAFAGQSKRGMPAPLWRVAAMFALVTAILYGNSLDTPFLLDDQYLHAREPAMRSPTAALASPWPRRLGMLSFSLNYRWHGLWMPGYHGVNIAIHWAAATVLFGLLRGTLTRLAVPSHSTWPAIPADPAVHAANGPRERADLWAGLVALLWLIHPLQTGSVTYVIQRFEALMGLFVLVSLYALMRAAEAAMGGDPSRGGLVGAKAEAEATSGRVGRRGAVWKSAFWQTAAVGAAFAAAATKEVAVALPILAISYDRIYWARSWRELARLRAPLHAGAILASAAIVYHSRSSLNGAIPTTAGFHVPGLTWWQYLRSQPEVLLHYLRLAIFPDRLCFDYGWPVATSPWRIYPAGMVIVAFLVLTGWLLVKSPRIGFPGLAFFALLAPTSSFMPVMDLAFEHRMYLPLAPVLVAIAVGIEWGMNRGLKCPARRATALAVGAAIVCSALGARTFLRNRDYADPLRMWQSVVEANPAGSRGHLMYALQLTAIGRLDEAETHYQKALALRKDMPEAHVGLGYVRMKHGRLDEAERFLRMGVEHPRTTHVAHYNLGKLREIQARLEHALLHYQWSVEFQPDYAQSWEAMAKLAGKLGKTRVEIAAWRRVHEITPHAPDPAVRLTRLLATADERKGGNPTEALTLAKQLLRRRDVDRRTALDCLAAAQRANGQFAAAEKTAGEASRLPGGRAEQRRSETNYRAERPARNADLDRVRR